MTETTNLGLPIYGANDVPDWMNTNDGFEALDSLVNSCANVELDWSNPLHNFTDGNLSYTVTQDDCYLCGQTFSYTQNNSLKINNKTIAMGYGDSGVYIWDWMPPLKLSKGDVIQVSKIMPYLFVLKGKLVSGNTYVFNEAQVTLDYANPLHTFSTNNLSYTATQDCYIVGPLANTRTLKINNTTVQVTGQDKVQPIYLKLSKGDTAVINIADENLKVYGYTVTGSVSALHSDIPDYSNLIASLAYNDETYTATEECIVEFYFLSATLDNMAKVAVNDHVIGVTYNDTNTHMYFYKSIHLQKGDVLTWYGANQNLFVCNVFGLL